MRSLCPYIAFTFLTQSKLKTRFQTLSPRSTYNTCDGGQEQPHFKESKVLLSQAGLRKVKDLLKHLPKLVPKKLLLRYTSPKRQT